MIDRYETENSVYYIDTENRRYLRRPIWTQYDSSPKLQYGVWLPLADRDDAVTLVKKHGFRAPETQRPSLRIMHAESVHGIITSEVISHTQVEEVPHD